MARLGILFWRVLEFFKQLSDEDFSESTSEDNAFSADTQIYTNQRAYLQKLLRTV